MRLLLLLSALLGALTGVAGTRVAGQPVQASAPLSTTVASRAASAVVSQRPVETYAATPPLRLREPPVSAVVTRLLYAERRRQ